MFKALADLPEYLFERVVFKIMQVPQPWHPPSCTKHLAARAIMIVAEEAKTDIDFWEIADILFNLPMKDEDVINKTFQQLHEEIAAALPEKIDRQAFLKIMTPEVISNT